MNLRPLCYSFFFIISFQFLSGCITNKTDSVDVPTDEIYMLAKLDGRADGSVKIEVNMREEHPLGLAIELTGGESLVASYGDEEIKLRRNSDILEVDYEGTFRQQDSSGIYTITLYRADDTSEEMQIEMVESFSVSSPSEGETYTEYSFAPVMWSPTSNAPMKIDSYLLCSVIDSDDRTDSEHETEYIDDTGFHNFDVSDVVSSLRREVDWEDDILNTSVPCHFSLTVERYNSRSLDHIFAPLSRIESKHDREIDDMRVVLAPNP